jgi:GNAT superfamily N-acetyltransferase
MKVVSVLLAGQQVDREEENYRWILENRASLPAEVKDYLVNVYSVDRIPGKDLTDRKGQPYQMESGALVIVMELLEPAPEQVVNDLFARDRDAPLARQKEARIFKDEGAVYELVQNLVMRIDGYMSAAVDDYSRADAQRLIKSVTQAFFSGDAAAARKNMFVNYDELPYLGYEHQEMTDSRRRLLNVLFNKVDAEIPEENEYRVSILQYAANELDDKAHYYLQKQVIPISQRVHPDSPSGTSGTQTQEAFPEAAGLLNAMKYLHGKKWSPGDIHHKNVMARPQSGQIVIVDVGLFKRLNEYKEKRFPDYGITSLKYIPKKNPYLNNGELYYEMHIGVDPKFQGQGVARKIIMQFAAESRYPLYFGEARIINPNLIKVLERLEGDPRVERVEWGWIIR